MYSSRRAHGRPALAGRTEEVLLSEISTVIPLGRTMSRSRRTVGSPTGLLILLALGAALSGASISIAGRAVRLDQVASLLLAVRLATELLFGFRRLFIDGATVALGGYFAVTAFSSLTAPDPSNSILQTGNIAVLGIIYVWLINFLDSPTVFNRFVRVNFMVAIGAIGFGVVVYLTALVGVSDVLAPIGFSESVGYGAHGTMREPNIFGSYAALFFVLGLTTVAGRSSLPDLKLTSRLRLVSGIGLVLSFTRASWVGALAVVLPLLIGLRRRLRWSRIAALAGSAILAVSIAASPLVPENYLKFKVQNLVNFNTSSAAGRLAIWDKALTESVERPWFGWGCYSYGDKNAEPGTPRALRPWIGNFAVTALHDSGIIGTSLLFLFLGINLIGGLRASRQLWSIEPTSYIRLVGLVYGVVALLIAFLATTGFSYGYPWIALGLIGAYRRRARQLLRRRRLTVGDKLALESPPLTA